MPCQHIRLPHTCAPTHTDAQTHTPGHNPLLLYVLYREICQRQHGGSVKLILLALCGGHNCHGYKLNSNLKLSISVLSGESKHRPNESNMSQEYSERYRGLEVREELQGWGGGGLGIFSDTKKKSQMAGCQINLSL